MNISDHGGAVRYWVHDDGTRAVLCQDGKIMMMSRSRWRVTDTQPEHLDSNRLWKTDTRRSLSSAITRTNREARRDV